MDCNSYSYAPHMLDGDENTLVKYSNDDMSAEVTPAARGNVGAWVNGFDVWAYSYDGSLEVYEFFRDQDRAAELFNYIVENYHDTPPGGELNRYIRKLQREEARSA